MNSFMKKMLIGAGLATAACMATKTALRRSRWFSYAGKTVLITGGSRGLGLVMARQLVDAGARVAFCARTEEDIQAAERELQERGGEVLGIRCDVTSPHEVQSLVDQVRSRFGPVDVLFNVAGIIQVGPLDSMTRDDFENAMDTHYWGPLNTIMAVLPEMRERGWGRIVNVSSIGGKQAVPHLVPYCASKFALVGLSNGLRAELAQDGILVTTICPSLMRTGSPRNALFKAQHQREYTWFSISASLPVVAMSAERAAAQTLRACQNGDRELILKNPANIGILLQSMAPGLTQELLGMANRLLPKMGGIGHRAARGHHSETALSPSWLTSLGDEAAVQNNEMRTHPI